MKLIIDVENDIELQETEKKQLEEFIVRLGFRVNDIKQELDEIGKQYYISYRDEFEAVVIAKNEKEARQKFEDGSAEISCCGDLWEEYLSIKCDEIDDDEDD